MLGQRWDTLHLQRWPNIESQRWPNKVNNVGPTLGQRMRAVWEYNVMLILLELFGKWNETIHIDNCMTVVTMNVNYLDEDPVIMAVDSSDSAGKAFDCEY